MSVAEKERNQAVLLLIIIINNLFFCFGIAEDQ